MRASEEEKEGGEIKKNGTEREGTKTENGRPQTLFSLITGDGQDSSNLDFEFGGDSLTGLGTFVAKTKVTEAPRTDGRTMTELMRYVQSSIDTVLCVRTNSLTTFKSKPKPKPQLVQKSLGIKKRKDERCRCSACGG